MKRHAHRSVSSMKHPGFVRLAFMAGIIVALNVFFLIVVQIIIPAPQYSKYCPQPTKQAHSAAACEAQGGVWKEYPTLFGLPKLSSIKEKKSTYVPILSELPKLPSLPKLPKIKENIGFCKYNVNCQSYYNTASENAHLYSFILMMVLGIIALVIGVVPIGASIVSSGLSYGGVLALIIGSLQYWGSADSLLRLVISGFALVTLVYLGMRRFQDER